MRYSTELKVVRLRITCVECGKADVFEGIAHQLDQQAYDQGWRRLHEIESYGDQWDVCSESCAKAKVARLVERAYGSDAQDPPVVFGWDPAFPYVVGR